MLCSKSRRIQKYRLERKLKLFQDQEQEFEPAWKPREKWLRHPIRKIVLSFGFTLAILYFLGVISFYSSGLYLQPPHFPLMYTNLGTCLLCAQSYSAPSALLDFVFWYVLSSVEIFGIFALVTANSAITIGSGFSLSKRRANIMGLLVVVFILFAVFVPLVQTPNIGNISECTSSAPYQQCTGGTQFGSLTYTLFCEGAVWVYPTTSYTLSVCLNGQIRG